jgi:putative peptidoglycan lipid II flippase
MAVGTVLSRITGFGRVLALAYVLGFERLTDTYNLANTTPNIIYELILGGVLSATLVPVFVGSLEAGSDEDEGWRGISSLVTVAAALLVGLAVAFALAAPWIIRLYTVGNHTAGVADQRAVATTLLRLFAPQVALYGLVTLTTALLQARRRFAAPMFAPVLNNVVVIAVILALPRHLTLHAARGDRGLLLLLGLGTTAGVAVQAGAQILAAHRAGHRLRPRWDPGHALVRQVVRLSGWTFGFVVANQLALYVVLVLANRQRGGVSSYQAAQMFFVLPHAIFAVSIISALLPDLSGRWANRDVDGYRRGVAQGMRLTAVVLIPAAVGYLLLARPIVDVVLSHGALRHGDAATTARVLAAFAAGLPGFSAFLLITRAFQAMKDTKTVFWLYVVENGLNVVLALALFPAFGVVGLAASYAAAYTAAALIGGSVLARRAAGLEGDALRTTLIKVASATALMAAAVAAVDRALAPGRGLMRVGAGVILGVSVYLGSVHLLRLPELQALRTRRRPT